VFVLFNKVKQGVPRDQIENLIVGGETAVHKLFFRVNVEVKSFHDESFLLIFYQDSDALLIQIKVSELQVLFTHSDQLPAVVRKAGRVDALRQSILSNQFFLTPVSYE